MLEELAGLFLFLAVERGRGEEWESREADFEPQGMKTDRKFF